MAIKSPFLSFLSILSPIIVGLFIYTLFRGIPLLHSKSLMPSPIHNPLLSVCVYNLPDALWLFALLQSFKVIWRSELYSKGLPWVCVSIAGAILSEYAQKLHVIPGTFDLLDIAAYMNATAIFILLNTTIFINQNKFSV